MIQSDRATFSVHSSETDPALITRVLGVEPTRVVLAGTRRESGKPRPDNHWVVDGPWRSNTEADQTGTGALRDLLARLGPAAGNLQKLPKDCDARIWWSANSDSTQGGFVLPADLSYAIAELGIDVYVTVYLGADDYGDAEGRF